jgi:hypothetical protein
MPRDESRLLLALAEDAATIDPRPPCRYDSGVTGTCFWMACSRRATTGTGRTPPHDWHRPARWLSDPSTQRAGCGPASREARWSDPSRPPDGFDAGVNLWRRSTGQALADSYVGLPAGPIDVPPFASCADWPAPRAALAASYEPSLSRLRVLIPSHAPPSAPSRITDLRNP